MGTSLGIKQGVRAGQVNYDTTAHWNAQPLLVALAGQIYVYSDYMTINDEPVAGIKVGDGTSYLIDLPFVAGNETHLNEHANNANIHVTISEKEFWDNKVSCFLSAVDAEKLVFTTEGE